VEYTLVACEVVALCCVVVLVGGIVKIIGGGDSDGFFLGSLVSWLSLSLSLSSSSWPVASPTKNPPTSTIMGPIIIGNEHPGQGGMGILISG
jgi:hypothetical protein